jgi:hypothetical protein
MWGIPKRCARAPLISLVACALVTGCGPSGTGQIPADLKIVAQFYPGYSSLRPWRSTIARDGTVVQEIFYSNDPKRDSGLTEDDLKALVKEIDEADFFGLQERYDYPITDSQTLELSITRNRKTHEVAVYAPDQQAKNEDVKRFLRIWAEILRRVPAPGPDPERRR